MEKKIIKACKHCGPSQHFWVPCERRYRCQVCVTTNVRECRRRHKRTLVGMFGGGCRICGYKKCMDALHFHHIDPSTKNPAIFRGGNPAFKRMLAEAKKCVLLCGNCHEEVEAGVTELPQYLINEVLERLEADAEAKDGLRHYA